MDKNVHFLISYMNELNSNPVIVSWILSVKVDVNKIMYFFV